VKFQGNRGNRGPNATFTSNWWVSSPKYRHWQKLHQVQAFQPGLLFARNDWLLPGWPLGPLGFSPTSESEYDRPNIQSFITASRDVAIPLFATFASAECAAEWALANLDPLEREDLVRFLRRQ
jgi:hypothetical protein